MVVHEVLGPRARDVDQPIIDYIINVLADEDFDIGDDGEDAFDAVDELLISTECVDDASECRQHIKAIITADEMLLGDPMDDNVVPIVEELQRRFSPIMTIDQGLGKDGEDNPILEVQNDTENGEENEFPFEFRALEVVLEAICSFLNARTRELETAAYPALDELTSKAAYAEGQEASMVTDYTLKVLGLEDCADIMVGNDLMRGISGGQRKRVTTGEMLVGPAKGLFMDEIFTGLDSSTTFQIVKSLKQYIHILNQTAVISLLQPAPEER